MGSQLEEASQVLTSTEASFSEYYMDNVIKYYLKIKAIQEKTHIPFKYKEYIENFFDLMRSENARLKSFQNRRDVEFVSEVTPEGLAKSGFFFLDYDRVMCAFCCKIISGWNFNVASALNEQAEHFSNCLFFTDCEVGNIPLEITEDICGNNKVREVDTPPPTTANEKYSTIESRLDSFNNPGWKMSKNISIQSLAEAGFYSIGIQDYVKCFCCDCGLCNWFNGDDPWIEHAMFSPKCAFVQLNKSEEFIKICKLFRNAPNDSNGEPNCSYLFDNVPQTNLQTSMENLNLDDKLLCKICFDNKVKVVYMPCGHIISCIPCALWINKCPICRVVIEKCVRIYFT